MSRRIITTLIGIAALGSVLIATDASARSHRQTGYDGPAWAEQTDVVAPSQGPESHGAESAWPEGRENYHGANGG
jgi:hypothetical protein